MRRSESRFTSGLRSTPRTTLKIAALAPMPSARVTTTVSVRPLARSNDRRAKRRSAMKVIAGLFFENTAAGRRLAPRAGCPFYSRNRGRQIDNACDEIFLRLGTSRRRPFGRAPYAPGLPEMAPFVGDDHVKTGRQAEPDARDERIRKADAREIDAGIAPEKPAHLLVP